MKIGSGIGSGLESVRCRCALAGDSWPQKKCVTRAICLQRMAVDKFVPTRQRLRGSADLPLRLAACVSGGWNDLHDSCSIVFSILVAFQGFSNGARIIKSRYVLGIQ